MAREFVPVFIDTLRDERTTARFGENPGSYPVLRVHDLRGRDIGGRLDGNQVAGRIPLRDVENQLVQAMGEFTRP